MKTTRKGFTLVELIVVIAILGILSAVAVPVYKGYIKRANEAADLQLLAAVNQSFGSACIENGISKLTEAYGDAQLAQNKTVDRASITASMGQVSLEASFSKYFKGNENTPFKYYTDIEYDDDKGYFVGKNEDGAHYIVIETLDSGNVSVKINNEAAKKTKDSSFGRMSSEEVIDLAGSLVNTLAGTSAATTSLVNDAKFAAYMEEMELNSSNNQDVALALATYAAEKMSAVDSETVANALTGNFDQDLREMYKVVSGKDNPNQATYSEKAVAAAVMYAMSASYAKSDAGIAAGVEMPTGDAEIYNAGSLYTVMAPLYQTQEFKDYLTSDVGKEDIAGLIGALTEVNLNNKLVYQIAQWEGGLSSSNQDAVDIISKFLGN